MFNKIVIGRFAKIKQKMLLNIWKIFTIVNKPWIWNFLAMFRKKGGIL